MPISAEKLKEIMPATRCAATFAGPLAAAMAEAGIDTPRRAAMFLAQIAHESAEMNRLVENLNYSGAGLLNTFPGHFSEAEARTFAHRPEPIASRAYANRNGNGDEASGDGWRYRGRGLIQVTGKRNYTDCAKALDLDLVAQPESLETPEAAARSAAWFWRKQKLNAFADEGDLEGCTRKINGGLNGMEARRDYYERAMRVLGVVESAALNPSCPGLPRASTTLPASEERPGWPG